MFVYSGPSIVNDYKDIQSWKTDSLIIYKKDKILLI